jgi:hypothetical protein
MKHLVGKPIQTLHFTAIRGISDEEQVNQFKRTFDHMFKLLQDNSAHWILDRSHVGDWVYSKKYRNHEPFWVWELEKTWAIPERNDVFLITFIDSSFKSLEREDGDSWSEEKSDREEEIELFKEATEMSGIKHKLIVDIAEKSINEVEAFIWKNLGLLGVGDQI